MECRRKTNGTEEAAMAVVLLAFCLVQQPITCVSAESDSHMLHLESITAHHHQTWGDSVLYDDLLTGGKSAVSELRNFDVKPVFCPTVTFSTHLPVSWTEGELIRPNKYLWTFDDLEVGKTIYPGVLFDGSVEFAPDFSASRTMTETLFTDPGGRQTLTLTFTLARGTPSEKDLVGYEPFLIGFGVEVWEDDNVDPAIDAGCVVLPIPGLGEGLVIHCQDEDKVAGFIQNPTVGTPHTLVVPIDIKLKEGVNKVEYKPHVSVINRFAHWLDAPFGRGVTVNTEVGTWEWQTSSEHLWLCWNSMETSVEFLARSRALPFEATVDIDPDILNLKSKDKFVTCYIELPEGYDVADIDVSTILLNGEVAAESKPTEIGDHDGDGIPDLIVKFDRAAVQEILEAGGRVEIVVSGELANGTPFEGTDTVRVIDK